MTVQGLLILAGLLFLAFLAVRRFVNASPAACATSRSVRSWSPG